jgi:hypothetical protein
MLVRLLYSSEAAEGSDPQLLSSILEQSRLHNPARGLTGVLCVADDLFIQVLEGGRDEVCELYNAIVRDKRHHKIRLLAYEEIEERKFGNWTMGQVHASNINPSLLLRYFTHARLDPTAGSGRATMALLEELVASATILSRPD